MIAIIVSLKFNPGHVSHLVASYKQCEELGYTSYYYVDKGFLPFLPNGSRIKVYGQDKLKNIDLAIFTFPSQHNLLEMFKLKFLGKAKILYIFHEPIYSFKEYRESGYTRFQVMLERCKNWIGALSVLLSDAVLLPSKKALDNYERSSLYKKSNYYYLPLMYDDERNVTHKGLERRYFSYIGTVATDHSFNEYLDFVELAVKNSMIPDIDFLIATKSEFELPEILRNSPRVVVCKGHPMSDDEINKHYASTYIIWNAYERLTQSGVLAKSFMFGTPAIVLRKNLSEFTEDGKEVIAIDDNRSVQQIKCAIDTIVNGFESFSSACRKRFENSFYYRNYNGRIEEILNKE